MARLEEKFKARAEGKTGGPGGSVLPPRADLLSELPVAQIQTDPHQPRKDLGDLTELKASIASMGLIQPILVSVVEYGRYQIIAGERRFTAVRELGLPRIPAIVRTVEEHQRLELQIVENLHRQDLNPLEEAASYRRLIEEFGMTQDDVGRRLGKSQNSVNESLRLLALPASVQGEYRALSPLSNATRISKSLLLEIAKQPGEVAQRNLWEQAKRGQLTVKQVRQQKLSARLGHQGKERKASAVPARAGMLFRYPIQTDTATVTVTFEAPRATLDEIIAALEQALEGEKSRRGDQANVPSTVSLTGK
jgi:ParB/RepB/Spo0J family partition protein